MYKLFYSLFLFNNFIKIIPINIYQIKGNTLKNENERKK